MSSKVISVPELCTNVLGVTLQRPDDKWEECVISTFCTMVYCQIPPPMLVGDSILCILVFEDG